MLLLAGAVFLVSAAKLLAHMAPGVSVGLGDPDDAMRLVLVRDLLAGRGWFDQHLVRIQPPLAVCAAHGRAASDALGDRLEASSPPAWLAPLSPAGDALQVYRVR